MGNPFSVPCDPCVDKISKWLDEKVGYTHNLEKNLTALETTMVDLKANRDDLSRRLKREEDRGLQRLAKFQVWLSRVETIENKVNDLLNARNVELQRLCLCGFFSKSILSSYRYGKSVFLTLREIEKLKSEVFEEIFDQPLTPEVEERQLQPIIVGQETMLEKAWKHLKEDKVVTLGMYGMGGVGKTTLLSQINNKFSNDMCGFDYVIWVVVSKELQLEKIQDNIAQKIGLGGEEWNKKDKNQKADCLFNILSKKSFVLFLDDIWDKVDLAEIGVPFPTTQNKCKVAFDLFQKKVGQLTLGRDPGIPDLARIVAKKCCGLPLALNVIGETMSSKRTIQEWKRAIDVLNSYAAQFSGMKDIILPLLKYSYDDLKGEHIKLCLLYCALFPEDAKIDKETLIGYWMCEGIIDESEDIEKAENEGYDIIGSLVCQSLLMEEVDKEGKGVVSMHDVVRDMALWIASDLEKQKEAFIVLYKIPKVKNWKVVRRMSLMNNKIYDLDGSPECLELTTLLLQGGWLSTISSEFFKSMPKLAVLDLSGNLNLFKLPEEISNLVSLQYLNLSRTGIHHLPKGLQELKKLIHLNLEETRALQSIVGISSLHNLKVLNLRYSGLLWDLDMVRELEALKHLEILTITFDHGRMLEQFLRSHRLMSCTQSLGIERHGNAESSGISFRETMDKLREFNIYDCNISEIKMGTIKMEKLRELSFSSLVKVSIVECNSLRELTFLMFAQNLRFLEVKWARALEDIINKEKARQVENSGILPFQKLNELHLFCVRELKKIYWSPLPFPCLQRITINLCPNLKKLPLDSKSGKHGENGLIIKYTKKELIEGLKWEDEATKTRFLSSCRLVKFDLRENSGDEWRLR